MQTIIDLTQDLIRHRTMHSEPEEIQKCCAFIEAYLDRHRIAYTHIDHGGYPSVLVLPGGPDVKALFMTHIDVVDAPDNLFQPVIRDGDLYGRGAIDDKYAVALSLVLIKENMARLRNQGKSQHDLPFGILITADEEIGGHHGVAVAVDRVNPEFCIALDGGNPQKIVVKEKGLLTLKMIAAGKTAHGSRPWMGKNAVDNLVTDYMNLKTLFETPAPGTWFKTMNLSIIHAGKSFNQVPDRAEAVFDIRYTENDDPDRLLQEMQAMVGSRLEVMAKEPMFLGGESVYLDRLLELAGDARIGFEHGASDARFFSQRGVRGVIWGASGDLSAHADDEHVNIDSVLNLYQVLDRFVVAIA